MSRIHILTAMHTLVKNTAPERNSGRFEFYLNTTVSDKLKCQFSMGMKQKYFKYIKGLQVGFICTDISMPIKTGNHDKP